MCLRQASAAKTCRKHQAPHDSSGLRLTEKLAVFLVLKCGDALYGGVC